MNSFEAKQKLIDGNQRFINNQSLKAIFSPKQDNIKPQKPFAIVLGCSDSRVPIETIFDQSFGDLFIIRIAGNIVAPSQIGSIEFAVSLYQTPIVVVLGHTHCGAVSEALNSYKNNTALSKGLNSITNRIKPVIKPLFNKTKNEGDLICEIANANIKQSVEQLCNSSAILQDNIKKGQLEIVGAKYFLDNGVVEFFN
ncbi:Carbonic anhydrase [hydrothermal vent metagenome]|uniref:Carbonic anhydrase n=1 Tax=hydrothermal vent metagenome TaxID=652676 RepID=A0A1W1C3S5_9ZZZZ